MVRVAASEHLCLVLEPPEGAGVDYAVAVTLKGVAIRMRRLRMTSSTGVFDMDCIRSEHGASLAVGQGKQEATADLNG